MASDRLADVETFGDFLPRRLQTVLGDKVERVMSSGELVDDATMGEVIKERLAQEDARRGFILDGYPRTLPQADLLAEILAGMRAELDGVLYLQVPEGVLIERILGRKRADDTEDVIRQRLVVYRQQTRPLVGSARRFSAL